MWGRRRHLRHILKWCTVKISRASLPFMYCTRMQFSFLFVGGFVYCRSKRRSLERGTTWKGERQVLGGSNKASFPLSSRRNSKQTKSSLLVFPSGGSCGGWPKFPCLIVPPQKKKKKICKGTQAPMLVYCLRVQVFLCVCVCVFVPWPYRTTFW